MNDSALGPVLPEIQAIQQEMVALRHQIHANPELAYQEVATGDLVAERLAAWGYEVHRGLGVTGVVGTLRRGTGTRRLGLRADMDALPIHETTGLPYASQHPGKMHACGHDGHTATLLAAARALAETDLSAEEIARRAMRIAAEICIYTNDNVVLESLDEA